MIVHGLQDALVPAGNSRRLAAMLHGAELVLLDSCGHMPQEELPGAFADLVCAFVERL
jgi:pimeloyl-ACP methyl ester carboxylesterase